MVGVFFSYSHADEEYRNRLEKHLSPLKREGLISQWHDRKIHAGSNLHDEISKHVEEDQVILLLVSADFLASDYCQDIEMARAIERHKRKDAIVIPIIVHPCDWKNTVLGELRATPRDGRPISKHPHHDDAYLDIVTDIRKAISALDSQPQQKTPKPTQTMPTVSAYPSTRSSNLRIRKEFTDHDKDSFLDETFDYIFKYFEASLDELKARNPDIETRFKPQGQTFKTGIYRNGKKECWCKVWISDERHFGGGIAYSHTDSDSSFNEMLAIENDGYSLILKPFMRSGDTSLTQEGAAEHLWSMFIEPLQQG